eukprot:3849549-Alexandrium_andersonii.AAC.1
MFRVLPIQTRRLVDLAGGWSETILADLSFMHQHSPLVAYFTPPYVDAADLIDFVASQPKAWARAVKSAQQAVVDGGIQSSHGVSSQPPPSDEMS